MFSWLLQWIPPLPLYWPQSSTYLSEVILPDNKRIYISDAPSAADANLLALHRIQSMVTIRTPYVLFSPVYDRIDELPEIKKRYIYINDAPESNLFDYFESTTRFIHDCLQDNQECLIHCTAGRSRSVSFAIAYIMIVYCMDFADAYNLVKTHRPELCINNGFLHQLQTLDQLLHRININ